MAGNGLELNAIMDAFARYEMGNNAAPSGPTVSDARVSTAWMSFEKVEEIELPTDQANKSSCSGDGAAQTKTKTKTTKLGTVSVRLHSDLVPLGVQNFASHLTDRSRRYEGTRVRLLFAGGNASNTTSSNNEEGRGSQNENNQALALECGEIEATGLDAPAAVDEREQTWRSLREPYWRWGSNQHHFPHDGRGLLSWVGGKADRSGESASEGRKFYITLGAASELDRKHLVFGAVDLYDAQSARTIDEIERILKESQNENQRPQGISDSDESGSGSVTVFVRISDFRLVGYQFKDLLDCPRGTEINWDAVRSLLVLRKAHPSYSNGSMCQVRWIVGNNGTKPNERNILHAALNHSAPMDILSDAVQLVSTKDILAPDPLGEILPLSRALQRKVDGAITMQIIEKMDQAVAEDSGAVAHRYEDIVSTLCLAEVELPILRLLLDKVGCNRKALLPLLEKAVDGFILVRLEDESLETWWEGDGGVHFKLDKDEDQFAKIWGKIRCLLYAIEFGETGTRVDEESRDYFSPLGTLLRLGQMRPGGRCRYFMKSPLLPDDREDANQFAHSVLRLVEFVAKNSPETLNVLDSAGRSVIHHAATAFYSYYEQEDYPYDDFVRDFDGVTINSGFNLRGGEKILAFLLRAEVTKRALEKDERGDTVLSLLLKHKHRRPLVRIQLVLEAYPELCLEKDGNLETPLRIAMDLPKNILCYEPSVLEQLYVNNLFLSCHAKIGAAFDENGIFRRFKDFLRSISDRIDEFEYGVPALIMIQAARLLDLIGDSQLLGSTVLFDILQIAADSCEKLDDYDDYENIFRDQFESGANSLITASIGASPTNGSSFSVFTEKAFDSSSKDVCYDDEYDLPIRNVFYQRLLKFVLGTRPELCSFSSFLENSIPYYKKMAIAQVDEVASIRNESEPPKYETRTKEERISDKLKTLDRITEEAKGFTDLFLAAASEFSDLSCGKPILHAALEVGSDIDGIAKNILGSMPNGIGLIYQGKSPLHVAIESGCNENMIEHLLGAAPDLISLREGESSLYPFQTAACSEKSNLDKVFHLLRKAPNLLQSE